MIKKVKEIWKDIYFFDFIKNELVDYRGIYQVSNEGRVKSLKRTDFSGNKLKEKIIKPKTTEGYKSVGLCKNGKVRNFQVHRLVAFMFLENTNKEDNIFINHKDENPSNNCVENLEWCTPLYNVTYGNCLSKRNKTRLKNGTLKIMIGLDENNKIKSIVDDKRNDENYNISHIHECCKNNRINKKGRTIHKNLKWFYSEDYIIKFLQVKIDEE